VKTTPIMSLPIVRHLTWVLAIKLLALFVIWYFFFSQPVPVPQAQTLNQHFGLVTPASESPVEE
jgi:hypothetical protein